VKEVQSTSITWPKWEHLSFGPK